MKIIIIGQNWNFSCFGSVHKYLLIFIVLSGCSRISQKLHIVMYRISARVLIYFSKFSCGCLSEGAYIIASIINEIHKCNMQEFCYILPFTSTFHAQISRQQQLNWALLTLICIISCWYDFGGYNFKSMSILEDWRMGAYSRGGRLFEAGAYWIFLCLGWALIRWGFLFKGAFNQSITKYSEGLLFSI